MMVFKIGILALITIASTGYGLGISTSTSGLVEQCRDILTTVKTNLKSIPSAQLPSTICDIDDEELKGQCHELFDENSEEFLDFVDNVNIDEVCDYIVTSLDEEGLIDNSLHFQPVPGATDTEEVGNYICTICTKFMSFIHGFLSGRRHQAFALHILKGICHFVPIFKTECNLLINMYGRLILNLASRYLSPKICYMFHLCPGHLPNIQCAEPEDIPNGNKYIQGTSVGMEVEYACNQGFYMVLGGTRRTCGTDGKWTGSVPTCVKETEEN